MLTAEDGLRDTVAPRLVAAGADMSKVHFLTGTKAPGGDEQLFDLTRDVEALRDVLHDNPNIKIIVIDPLTAYLGATTKAKENADVRRVLTPLVKLIEETGVLVIGVTHLNKSQGKAIYRVLDSIGFVALGRILHLVIEDPDNPGNRKFICSKTNIGPKPRGLTFITQMVPVTTEDGKEDVSRISWGLSYIDESADEALETSTGIGTTNRTAKDEAAEFLRQVLGDGQPHDVWDVTRQAGRAGISAKALRSAREALGIKPARAGGLGSEGHWTWTLPKMPSPP
jgi:hypothetical protein